jgi:hypothetical protein
VPNWLNLSADRESPLEGSTKVQQLCFCDCTAENEMDVNVDQSATAGVVTADFVLMDGAYDWLDLV